MKTIFNLFWTRWFKASPLALLILTGFSPRLGAISGMEGTFEFSCDAPWRIEPHRKADGSLDYGAIPIQISIHDAKRAGNDNLLPHQYFAGPMGFSLENVPLPSALVSLGRFRRVHVRQLSPANSSVALVDLSAFHEIETTTGEWPALSILPEPAHRLCRRWAGEDPEPFRDLRDTSEWHGTFWLRPFTTTPGTTLTLEIEVVLERDPWPEVRGPLSSQRIDLDISSRFIFLRNYVRVHLAEEPLPRFDRRWLYGDFHYHSQGTDNEGESAYNYRGVVRAMGAMGLDFLFATEHASSSPQLMDLDLHIDLMEEFFGNLFGDVDPLEESDTDQYWGVLRDMDLRRYAECHRTIYGEKGVNRQATLQGGTQGALPQNYFSHRVVPQIFLGGELDTIPEVKASIIGPPPPPHPGPAPSPTLDLAAYYQWQAKWTAYKNWRPIPFGYGNGLTFDLAGLKSPGNQPHAILYESSGDAVLVHDFQGLDTYNLYGRGHLVYFPATSILDPFKESPFIPSYTSKYGGATRRLDATHQGRAALLPEIERKGIAFVAHHLNAGEGGRGPDGAPWTLDHMLLKAFRSPAILGLEFWNEDTRYTTRVCSHEYCRDDGFLGLELGYERNEYFAVLGYQPGELTDVPLALPEVRHGFVSGGSVGSQFELRSFSLPSGQWEQSSRGTEHALHHGCFDWDQLNLLGLDFEGRGTLSWLAADEPRRVFLGGGSDAHGDLNHRRAGYFLGTEDANDTAIGKPRNLLFVGDPAGPVIYDATPPIDPGVAGAGLDPADERLIDPDPVFPVIRTHTQEQVIGALRRGRFSVTDGPAIRIAIDMNGDFKIDDGDIQMGDVYRFRRSLPAGAGLPAERQSVTILTECLSTPEFGPVSRVHLYVGVQPGSGRTAGDARVYAPAWHGVRDPSRAYSSDLEETYISQGQAYSRMQDNYWYAPELTVVRRSGDGYSFTGATTIDLEHYEAGRGQVANRFFVRAFAETGANPSAQQPARYGFTNPIWLLRSPAYITTLPIAVEPVVRPPSRPAVAWTQDKLGRPAVEFLGILQYTSALGKPFADVTGAISPYPVSTTQKSGFFRARSAR